MGGGEILDTMVREGLFDKMVFQQTFFTIWPLIHMLNCLPISSMSLGLTLIEFISLKVVPTMLSKFLFLWHCLS